MRDPHTPPPARHGLPLEALAAAPAWVHPAGMAAPEAWWPLGRYQYTKLDGTRVDAVLVLAVGAAVGLSAQDPAQLVSQCRPDWPPAPDMGGLQQAQLRLVLELGAAVLRHVVVELGYRKDPGSEPEVRRLDHLVPRADGAALLAHDLDRNAPRAFRLDRIAWVRVPTP